MTHLEKKLAFDLFDKGRKNLIVIPQSGAIIE